MTEILNNSLFLTTMNLIERSQQEAGKGGKLVAYTIQVRENNNSGKYLVDRKIVDNMFDLNLWKEHKTKSGHRKLTHRLTRVVVEYSAHNEIDPGAALTILDSVQKHLNCLFNDIIVYNNLYLKKGYNENRTPNFKASTQRYLMLN